MCGLASVFIEAPEVDASLGTVAFSSASNAPPVDEEGTLGDDDAVTPQDPTQGTVAFKTEEIAAPQPFSLSDYQASHAMTIDSANVPVSAAPPDQTDAGQTSAFRAEPPAAEAMRTHLFDIAGNAAPPPPKRKRDKTPPWPPKPIAGYEMISALGRGAMGVVYMARHITLDRIVALKMVLAGTNATRRDRDRFISEARAVAQLAHPNILQIYEVGEQDGQPYFSLEFLDGGTLQDKIEKYSMPPREAAELIETLARALHYAHQKGILHRDIKPANVLMTSEGAPKFADFGLALRLDRNESPDRDMVVGTPTYMSPEQASGQTDIGPAADVYSLGATLYEMLVGRPPFRGATLMDTLKMVKTVEPVAPRQLQPGVPADLQTICMKCLHKDPKQRYQTAEAFANDLRNYLEGRPIDARPASAWEKTWKWARRNPAAALLITVSCVSLLAFAIGGVAFAIHEGNRAEEQSRLRETAETQEQIAQVERKKAEAQEKIAQSERKKAEEQRELAVKRGKEALDNFQSARNAVEVLVRVARDRMANEKHLETVGRELLENALVFYDDFRAKKPDDPVMRLQVARAQTLAGDLREKLGRYAQADETYQQAEKSYLDLLHDFPRQTSDYERDLASVYINRSTLLQVLNKPQDADAAFAKGKELLDKSTAKGRDATTDWMMGAGCNNRGIYLHQRGEAALAEQAYRQGITLFARLASEFPREPNYQVELAKTKMNLAYLWTVPAPGQPEKAEPLYQQALAELATIAKLQRDVPSFRKEYGLAFLNRGILYANQDRFAEADKDFASAADTFEQLQRAYPGVADYQYLTASTQISLGGSKQRQKDWTASITAYHRADERLGKLVADEPRIVAYQRDWALCAAELALAQEQLLRAAKTIDKDWPSLAADAERSWYQARDRWKKVNQLNPGELKNAAELVKAYGRIIELHKYLAGALRKVKPLEAETQSERRVAVCKEMLAQQPKERAFKELTGEALLTLALLRVEMKQHARAAETVDELDKLVPADSAWRPFAAGCLAQCVASADQTLKGDERDQAMKTYGDRAMALLEIAVAAGWNNAGFLRGSPLLQPLRVNPEYRKRLEQLQKQIEAK